MASSSNPPSAEAASASANAAAASTDDSFTMVGERDLEAIGAHCHAQYCNVLDFLPFRCESCKYLYCLDHRTETAHACPKAGAWAARRNAGASTTTTTTAAALSAQRPTPATGTQCSHPQCKTYIHTHTSVGVHCAACRREYCLKHRLAEDHACSTLVPLGARPATAAAATAAQRAASAFSKFRAWGKEKAQSAGTAPRILKPKAPSSSSSSSSAARIAALNALKGSAKGDAKIPPEKRVYVHVEAEARSTTAKVPRAQLFFSSDWPVGRVLDEAARAMQVQNLNNRGGGEEERLRVYHIEGGRLLEFSDKFGGDATGRSSGLGGAAVAPAKGVRSGDTIVLLRGVGPAVPDLIEV